MKSFSRIQNLILCSIVNSHLLRSHKIDCLNYLFWHLCWDFDIEALTQDIQNPCPCKAVGDENVCVG